MRAPPCPRALLLILAAAISSPAAAFTVAAAGDVMLGNHLVGERALRAPFGAAAQAFASADLAFVNLEGPLGPDYSRAKSCSGPPCHAFGADPDSASILAAQGVKAFSAANNHAFDLGSPGVASTREAARAAGLVASGLLDAQSDRVDFVASGRPVALFAFTSNSGPRDWRRPFASIGRQIAQAKAERRLVIVSVHAGCEGPSASSVADKDESCFGENRGNVVRFARAAVDSGADLVLGHGPHVPRALEIRSGRLIAYSLGNFFTAKGISVSGFAGLAPLLSAELRDDGSLASCSIESFRQVRGSPLALDESDAAAERMRALSLADFGAFPCSIRGRSSPSKPNANGS